MTFRTYRLGGDFVSVDLSQGEPPVEWDESWEITAEAYAAIRNHIVPVIEETGELVVVAEEFSPDPEPEP